MSNSPPDKLHNHRPTNQRNVDPSHELIQRRHHDNANLLAPFERLDIKPVDLDALADTSETLRVVHEEHKGFAFDLNLTVQNTITREADRETFQSVRQVQLGIPPRTHLPDVPVSMMVVILGGVLIVAIAVALAICL